MTTVYSERKNANLEVLVDQWHDALQHEQLWVVEAAWRRCRVDSEFFPSIAKFMGYVKAERPASSTPTRRHDADDADDAFGKDETARIREMERRAANCLKWRQQYANLFKPEPEKEHVPAPASQEGMTEALRRIAIANGYWRGSDEKEQAA